MKIWHQSFTVLEDLPPYAERLMSHSRKVLRPDTEIVLHGQIQGTYPDNYPVNDLQFSLLFHMHANQWVTRALQAEREGYDAYCIATVGTPILREIRTIVDIPVVSYAETGFHMACTLGSRFGLLKFGMGTGPMMRELSHTYGTDQHFGGVFSAGVTFHEVLAGYTGSPGKVIDAFTEHAKKAIATGVDVIIPAEMPLNLLLATEGVKNIDGVPIMDGLAVTLKTTEMMVDLKEMTGLTSTRVGFFGAAPNRKRVADVAKFYGLPELEKR